MAWPYKASFWKEIELIEYENQTKGDNKFLMSSNRNRIEICKNILKNLSPNNGKNS